MMPRTIGTIVKSGRTLLNLTREDLARKVRVSPTYVGHIERDDPVRVSKKLAQNLEKVLRVGPLKITDLMDQHNIHVLKINRWRRNKSA